MSNLEESKTDEPKKPAVRRSSLKASDSGSKLDPQNILKIKGGKRHSVSFGQSNTFQFTLFFRYPHFLHCHYFHFHYQSCY